jgi:hypothetical protein
VEKTEAAALGTSRCGRRLRRKDYERGRMTGGFVEIGEHEVLVLLRQGDGAGFGFGKGGRPGVVAARRGRPSPRRTEPRIAREVVFVMISLTSC